MGGPDLGGALDLGYVGGTFTRTDQTLSEPGASSFYKFTTLGSSTAANNVRINFTAAEGDLYLKVYRQDGSLVGESDNIYGYETVSLNGEPEGTYFVEVGSVKGDVSRDFKLTVTAPAGPDLTVTTVDSTVNQSAIPGESEDWTATIKNNGPGYQRANWTVEWYLSPVPYLSTYSLYAPTLIGTENYTESLAPGDSVDKTLTAVVPNIAKEGQKYLVAKVVNGGTDGYAYNDTKANYDRDWFGTVTPTVGGPDLGGALDLGYVGGTFTRTDQTLSEPGASSFYKFTTLGSSTAANNVRINFTAAEGDLYLKVYRQDGSLVGESDNIYGYETVSLSGEPEGTYFVEVGSVKGDVSRDFKLTVTAPAGPDLTVTTVDSTVNQSAIPGESEDWTATIKNNGPGYQRANWTVEWYLSPVPYLSTYSLYAPTLIGTENYTESLAPGDSVDKTLTAVVPNIAKEGQKYLVAKVVNGGTDGYAYNDTKANYDRDWFGTVTPTVGGPDLGGALDLGYVGGTFTRTDQTLSEPGASSFYKFTTLGSSTAANNVRINFTAAEGDLYLKVYRQDGSLVGESDNIYGYETVSLSGEPEGTYFVEVGSVKGDVSRDFKLTVTAPAGPDLTVTTVDSTVNQSAIPGESEDWTATIKNNGPGYQRANWTVEWYLSPVPYLSTYSLYAPTLIGTENYTESLAPGDSVDKTLTAVVPNIAKEGQKYLVAKVVNGGTDGTAYNDTKANYDRDWFGRSRRRWAGLTWAARWTSATSAGRSRGRTRRSRSPVRRRSTSSRRWAVRRRRTMCGSTSRPPRATCI